MQMQMQAEEGDALATVQRLLLEALADLSRVPGLPPDELDLVLRLVRRVRLLGRLGWQLRNRGVLAEQPAVVADQLLSALVVAESRARAARWELNRLAWALEDLPDVPLVAMKGCAYLLAGTPNAAGRVFSDVDLLVPEADLPEVEGRLRERGWLSNKLTPYDERHYRIRSHELPPMTHREREVEVDLHHNLLMRTARLKPASALLFAAARTVPGSRFKVLAPADMVLHAMVHLFYGGEMDDALRELVDIDDLLRYFGEHEPGFWACFWPRAEELDLARPAFYGLRYARELLGTPVPESVIAVSRVGAPAPPIGWLMDRLVPRALFPQPLDAPSRLTSAARRMLYIRSHWVKMPPVMLARHLGRKAYQRTIGLGRPEPKTG